MLSRTEPQAREAAVTAKNHTGANRCWPCTVVNAVAGLVVAVVPLVAALQSGDRLVVAGALVWSAVVVGFTVYRLLRRGYLPLAEPVAKLTGLHECIGPDEDRREKR